ncbi:MAG: hypothetical protein IPH26_18110 [Sterolibacteriaceae bacterium]|uniref:Uncharacterized protein n=1 Tax=Candidatus Methylophosphatis roskildensis TaxID=2899263 RepID=A0A9D7EBX3_9PROT|nr:hypothetical protein [Candidatus Methylophosphatis roskildensis]MBK7237953.1 hypothetical protein [Sterolibacteriaceae bacterium]
MKPVPQTAAEWVEEIALAYEDAREAQPFMPLVGVLPRDRKLFHLAPHVAIKFRALPESRRQAAVEAALCTYVASEGKGLRDDPRVAFALCYLASHFGLNLVSQNTVDEVMDQIAAGGVKATSSRKRGSRSGLRRPAPANTNRRR